MTDSDLPDTDRVVPYARLTDPFNDGAMNYSTLSNCKRYETPHSEKRR